MIRVVVVMITMAVVMFKGRMKVVVGCFGWGGKGRFVSTAYRLAVYGLG